VAYFSQQGAAIAEGVGAYFDQAPPVAMAYKDGVFGRRLRDQDAKLMAYRDGALGGPLYLNGQLLSEPVTITHAGGGEGSDGGVLGPGAAEGSGAEGAESSPGLLTAYREGILGSPPYIQAMPGRRRAYREGIIGAPAYDEMATLELPVAGLGAAANGTTLNLKAADVVRQVKEALALSWGEPMTEVGQQTWDRAFYDSPIWGAKSTELARGWAEYIVAHPNTEPGVTTGLLLVETPKGAYPTPIGVNAMIMTGIAVLEGVDMNARYPDLAAWMAAGMGGAAPDSFEVIAPNFSEAERIAAETGGVKMSTVALVGLGAVGLIGAVVVLKGRRKK
jgi:hypothetical protein